MATELNALITSLRRFTHERDWEQFHSPKNLASALAVEAGELLEHFQWQTEAQSRAMAPDKVEAVSREIADVFLYLLQLSDALGVDLLRAAEQKIALNAQKYPVERARGNSKKYTEL